LGEKIRFYIVDGNQVAMDGNMIKASKISRAGKNSITHLKMFSMVVSPPKTYIFNPTFSDQFFNFYAQSPL